MAKREKEVVVYIKMEEVTKRQLEEAARKLEQSLSAYCRMKLIQGLEK